MQKRETRLIPGMHRATEHDQSTKSGHRCQHPVTVMGEQSHEFRAALNRALAQSGLRGNGARPAGAPVDLPPESA
jgi:hypothetical protein